MLREPGQVPWEPSCPAPALRELLALTVPPKTAPASGQYPGGRRASFHSDHPESVSSAAPRPLGVIAADNPGEVWPGSRSPTPVGANLDWLTSIDLGRATFGDASTVEPQGRPGMAHRVHPAWRLTQAST